jgi:hypothetical protein
VGREFSTHQEKKSIPEEKRLLGRPGPRRERNIKTDLREIGCGAMDWIHLTQDRYQWRIL